MHTSSGKRENGRQSQRDHVPPHPDTPEGDAAQQMLHARLASGHRGHDDRGERRPEEARDSQQRREPQEWIDPPGEEIGQNEEGDQQMFSPNPPRSAGPCGLRQEGLVDLLTAYQEGDPDRGPQQRQQQILGGTEERVREMS
jgi:hypothetical protein